MLEEKQGEGRGKRSTSRTLALVTVLAVVVMVLGTWADLALGGGDYSKYGDFLPNAALPLATGVIPAVFNYISKGVSRNVRSDGP